MRKCFMERERQRKGERKRDDDILNIPHLLVPRSLIRCERGATRLLIFIAANHKMEEILVIFSTKTAEARWRRKRCIITE